MSWWQWLLIAVGVALGVYAALVAWLLVAGRRQDARAVAGFIPDCLVLFRRILGDPRVPRPSKLLLAALIGYLAMPLDLVPDLFPVAGHLDDALIVVFVLRHVLRAQRARAPTRPLARTRHLPWSAASAGLRISRRPARRLVSADPQQSLTGALIGAPPGSALAAGCTCASGTLCEAQPVIVVLAVGPRFAGGRVPRSVRQQCVRGGGGQPLLVRRDGAGRVPGTGLQRLLARRMRKKNPG
jgi:uncharacterized membrane protein YkvA (DUF1232 family)